MDSKTHSDKEIPLLSEMVEKEEEKENKESVIQIPPNASTKDTEGLEAAMLLEHGGEDEEDLADSLLHISNSQNEREKLKRDTHVFEMLAVFVSLLDVFFIVRRMITTFSYEARLFPLIVTGLLLIFAPSLYRWKSSFNKSVLTTPNYYSGNSRRAYPIAVFRITGMIFLLVILLTVSLLSF